MNWMKKHLSTILLLAVFTAGLCLLLYPSLSNYWNSFHQSRAIASYAEQVAQMDDGRYERMLKEAEDYNTELSSKPFHLSLTDGELEQYRSVLDVTGTGIMSYIEIPKIDCSLPIYHGTDEGVLQIAIGHIAGTSLPVGGESTHCVLSGHRGLPSAKLFTEIDKLTYGDTFNIRTLDEVLTYEVDQILIVLPEQIESLQIEAGKDYCTLVTCTPYGINSHRLLVRGHRIASEDTGEYRVTADAQQIEPTLVAPIVAVPILILLLIILIVTSRKKG